MLFSAVADQQLPDPEIIRTIIPGITEGGAIIICTLVVLILVLFYFGRVLAKRLELFLSELRSTRAEVTETKQVAEAGTFQVQNNHDSNLRDDLDAKHDVVLETFVREMQSLRADITTRFDGVNQRIAGIDRRVDGLDTRLSRHTGTIKRPNEES